MHKVTAIRHVEDCFNGDFIREYELDRPLDEPIMRRLARHATLHHYPDFPRPYFRIERRGAFTIQGVIGKTMFRVTFSRSAPDDVERLLKSQIEEGGCDGCEAVPVLPTG